MFFISLHFKFFSEWGGVPTNNIQWEGYGYLSGITQCTIIIIIVFLINLIYKQQDSEEFLGLTTSGSFNRSICWVREPTEGVRGIRPYVTFDVRSNSPFVSQVNTMKFGRRI